MEFCELSASSKILSRQETSAAAAGNYDLLRISCWIVALGLGAAEAWGTRFNVNPDGISYLDIGDAYWHGDWHSAINAYWSPLYSWILGFFLKVIKPSPYWEYPLVHWVNFLIYVATLACFEFFLKTFIVQRRRRGQELSNDGQMGLPEPAWWLLGYTLFVCSFLLLIGLGLVTPDMCVAAFISLGSALVLKIRAGDTSGRTLVILGLVLGFGYLAKAVLFPLGLVFLLTAVWTARGTRNWFHTAALATLTFAAITGPFIAAISDAKGRPTFGDSGRLTYAGCIGGVDPWYPGDGGRLDCDGTGYVEDIDGPSVAQVGSLRHPPDKIFDNPAAYSFGRTITGTYPFWYDPSYWQDGVRGRFDRVTELRTIGRSLRIYYDLLTTVDFNILVPFLALLFISSSPLQSWKRVTEHWELLVPTATGLILYSLVHTEVRYVAASVVVLWLLLFERLRFRDSPEMRRFLTLASVAIAATSLVFDGRIIVDDALASRGAPPIYWQAADAMNSVGGRPGAKIATIAPEAFGTGGAFVARLAREQIIAQVNQPDRFWASPASTQLAVLEAFQNAGAEGVLGYEIPKSAAGWHRLGKTDYYFLKLDNLPK